MTGRPSRFRSLRNSGRAAGIVSARRT